MTITTPPFRSWLPAATVVLAAVAVAGCDREPPPPTEPASTETAPEPMPAPPLAGVEPVVEPVADPPTIAMGPPPGDAVPTVGADDEADESKDSPRVDPTAVTHAGADPRGTLLAVANSRYAQLLDVAVDAEGLVRYDRLDSATWSASLDSIVAAYAKASMPEDRAARLAFLCNAYNANVLAMVVEERRAGPVESVEAVDGFFDERSITVAGQTMTLNGLENDHVRPHDDPRTHAALVCAAASCPPLRDEPYRATRLDEQLDDQSRRWVNDASKNRLDDDGLRLSRIFEWYEADFATEPYGDVVGFVRAYADAEGPFASLGVSAETPDVGYLEYDWALNAAPARDEPEK
ncbi:MAG: DUF547 domain-containing protein [Planctomycetota bacterium]|jgi:hypothetical protein